MKLPEEKPKNPNKLCFYQTVHLHSHFSAESIDLSRELEEAQSKLSQLARVKFTMTSLTDELKRQLDEETKVLN